jgi:tetratricopeptide (TPR) repeat protein
MRKKRRGVSFMRSAWLRGAPLLLLLIGAAWAGTSLPGGDGKPLTQAEIYQRTRRGTAWVISPDASKGTGWIIDRSRRLLITCAHVVGDNKTVDIVFPVHAKAAVIADRSYYFEHMADLHTAGMAVRGHVLKRNPDVDLALVELDSLPESVEELPLAEEGAQPGDRVQIVGCRYDVDSLWVHSGGAVSQVETLRKGYFSNGKELAKGARIISAQVPINEGDSGGPLVNERGEVVGIAAAVTWEEHGAGLFIDAAEVRALAEHIGPIGPISPKEPIKTPVLTKSFAPREVYRQGLHSLALLRTDGDGRFSAWLFDRSRRLLLTTAEAVGKHETVEVVFPVYQGDTAVSDAAVYRDEPRLLKEKGALTTGTVLATDARRNLAVLEVEAVPDEATETRFALDSPAPGDSLHALSNPNRLDSLWAYTACAVRQLGRANLGQTKDVPDPAVLIVQAPLIEGDGGGPLLNDRAELVGVVTGRTGPQQQVAFCLTLDEVRAFLNENRLRWEPASAAALVQRGDVFIKARQYARAHADFDAAQRLDSRYAPAWCEQGRTDYLQGDDDAAVHSCDRAVELDPKLAAGYTWRAAALSRKGEQQKAIADCDAALSADPQSAMAYAVRGNAYRLKGDLVHAQKDCDEAVWLDRQLPWAYLYRGQVYGQKGDGNMAVADYSRVLQFDEHLSEAYRCRGDAEWQRSDTAAALKDYDQALALNPKDALALQGRARALAAQRNR